MASAKEIKSEFLSNPELLARYLENWFYHIRIKSKFISCGRAEDSSPTGLTLYLKENDDLHIIDYSNAINEELFSYLIEQRGETFRNLMLLANEVLGLDAGFSSEKETYFFEGLYQSISEEKTETRSEYPEACLDEFENVYAQRFLDDGIGIQAQDAFQVRFSPSDNAIVFPIRNEEGSIIALKARANEDDPQRSKYFSILEGQTSQTLYGYSENYSYLTKGEILVFEAEKSVMQCYSMGIRNAVALGSSSLSDKQIQLLLSLRPQKIILAYDEGLNPEVVHKNAQNLMLYSPLADLVVEYIDFEEAKLFYDIPAKSSPSDLGKEMFQELRENFTERIKPIDQN